MTQDTIPALVLSAQGGQGDSSSKLFYIHQIEAQLAACSRAARPEAWEPAALQASASDLFPEVGEGFLTDRPPMPEGPFGAVKRYTSAELSLVQRAALLWDVQMELGRDLVAKIANVDKATVELVVEETVSALIELRMTPYDAPASWLSYGEALRAWKAEAAVAKEVKHRAVIAHMDALLVDQQWAALNRWWRDWHSCRHHEWVSVGDARPAGRLIQGLLDAGVPRDSLAIVSATAGAPLSGRVAAYALQPGRPVKPYRGRPTHRLVMTAHGVCAAHAQAGAVTMIGLHWWFVVLVSALIARGAL